MRSCLTRRPLSLAVAASLCPSPAALRSLSSVLLLATAAQLAQAAEAPAAVDEADAAAKTLDSVSVISTGTRKANMAVTDSPAPIQLISAEKLSQTGAADVMNALAMQVPSFNANQTGGDMASQTLTAALRNLSPNHTLILINGKRRHVTSNANVSSGAQTVDLSFIPKGAIDHVEVLTDGAAALYGSDAIAGVVNIILKKNYNGGEVEASYGGYGDGGGHDPQFSGNFGYGTDKGYFNVSAEVENRQSVFRNSNSAVGNCLSDIAACQAYATANNRTALLGYIANDQGAIQNPNFPATNTWNSPPEVHRKVGMFNAGYYFDNGVEFYAFGSYGRKTAKSYENYRRPSQDGGYTDPDTGEVTHKYATGFNPMEASKETDYDLTAGFKGEFGNGWMWDASTEYGRNEMDVYTLHSMNFTMWNDYGYSPENFYDGTFYSTQWDTNFNVTKDFDIGLSAPLTFNTGVEYRRDGYGIEAGEAASYYGAGASSFPGYSPSVANDYSRHSYAVFTDVVLNPTEHWLVDGAVRYEKYSDFGDKTIGKLTTRYDFTDTFAIRATASTGFRAPTMGENYYSAIQVSPTGATATLAAATVGSGLKPETSTNFSLGFVFNPIRNLTATLDAYQIKIKDRTYMGTFNYSTAQSADTVTGRTTGSWNELLPDPADTNGDGVPDDSYNQILGEALVAGGFISQWDDPTASGGSIDQTARANIDLSFFSNVLDTKSTGVDLVVTYLSELGWGTIDWNLAANYSKTEVTRAGRATGFESIPLFTDLNIWDIEHNYPKYRINLGGTLNVGKFAINLTEQIYGKQDVTAYNAVLASSYTAAGLSFPIETIGGTDYVKEEIGVMALTNLNIAFKPTDKITFSIGSNNIFNQYPDKIPSAVWNYDVANYQNGNSEYLSGSPIGYFGAYYYAKVNYRF
ncbi:TonB-dependent receptor [Pseudoxanthomonas sp.]|uniref:TonB-dependent receptor domain-containing protein n=1 Tax=Pseudoxanthomonas sp. TaxID=1871049 RepID=UPI002611B16F|nr:TonB-dependent receptor [Pseudoxanthomonas sp.]WDS35756.1 MAG: TonB-dependent receptor [Pseudoxanthomonas sp.]